jgi:hypothetical protein
MPRTLVMCIGMLATLNFGCAESAREQFHAPVGPVEMILGPKDEFQEGLGETVVLTEDERLRIWSYLQSIVLPNDTNVLRYPVAFPRVNWTDVNGVALQVHCIGETPATKGCVSIAIGSEGSVLRRDYLVHAPAFRQFLIELREAKLESS